MKRVDKLFRGRPAGDIRHNLGFPFPVSRFTNTLAIEGKRVSRSWGKIDGKVEAMGTGGRCVLTEGIYPSRLQKLPATFVNPSLRPSVRQRALSFRVAVFKLSISVVPTDSPRRFWKT